MQAWDSFVSQLEQTLGKEVVAQWILPFKIVKFDAGNIYLEAENAFQISWFKEHVLSHAKKHLLNNNARPIKIHFSQEVKAGKHKHNQASLELELLKLSVDPDLTFANFISDEKNKECVTFLEQLTPGLFNPLYLHGPSGVGKTHLLHAVGNQLKEAGYKVTYLRAETFTEDVVKAIQASQMTQFRQTYRNTDVFLVDNVEYFARKSATQEEFFHTFNTLHQAGKQIVLASPLAPSQLEDIEPRLVSRFEWGIVWPIYPLENREMEDLLIKKASQSKYTLRSDVLEFICDQFSTTHHKMRALDALMLRDHSSTPVSLEFAQSLLKDLLEDEKKEQITETTILEKVSEFYSIAQSDLIGKSQKKEHVLPRKIAMYLIRNRLRFSYQKIGRLFSKDHSTVMTSVGQVEQKSTSEEIRSALDKLEKDLTV